MTDAEPRLDIWKSAFEVIRAQAFRWRQGRRVTESAADYVEPVSFCDDLLAHALSDRLFLKTGARLAFFDWACAQPQVKVIFPVLAGHDLLLRGDTQNALRHLDHALVVDQEDLYAQELWFRARGEPIQPVDTSTYFCTNPFERLESASRDRLMFCCPAWLPVPAGNLDSDSAEAVWNSSTAQDIRRSIHEGDYKYCSRMHCPMFTDGMMPKVANIRNPQTREAIVEKKTIMPMKVRRVHLAHDRSCNLSCPSCRTKLLIAGKEENKRMDDLTEKALMPILLSSASVGITGSGDPFSSKHYRTIIRRLTQIKDGPKIGLQTNGLLMARSWDELGLEGRVTTVLLSIDAATSATYATIRRGGEFEDLLENLAFLSALRKRNGVDYVRLDFVTQAQNFREMPAAADLMRHFEFDHIKFQMLRSWNTWSTEDFVKQHVGHPGHPEYGALREVLQDPRLRGDDVQFSGFYSLERASSSSVAKSEPGVSISKGEALQAASLA